MTSYRVECGHSLLGACPAPRLLLQGTTCQSHGLHSKITSTSEPHHWQAWECRAELSLPAPCTGTQLLSGCCQG